MIYLKHLILIVIVIFNSCTSSKSNYNGRIGMTCMDLTNPFFKLIST